MRVNSARSTENIMTHGWVLAFGNPAQNPAGWAMSRPKPGPARPSNKPSLTPPHPTLSDTLFTNCLFWMFSFVCMD